MPALAMKYGDKIRSLVLLICFCILVVELSLLTAWWRAAEHESKNNTITFVVMENVTIETAQHLKTAGNIQMNEKNEVKQTSPTTEPKQDPKESKKIIDKLEEAADLRIQKAMEPFVNDSLGRIMNVDFHGVRVTNSEKESTDVLDIVYRKAKHGVNVLEPRIELSQPLVRRYVYVYERYREQLTMNTRVLMALASQAKFGGRFVLEPKVKDSTFGDTGYPLSTYYDVAQMNALLRANGYSTLVTEDEFNKECSDGGHFDAILHFLYKDNKAVSYLKKKFSLTTRQYEEIRRASKSGWTECQSLKPDFSPALKVFCVDPAIVTEWSSLERAILRGIKCLGIFVWCGIGLSRTAFGEKHVNISSKEIHFLLKPSLTILNEAEMFTKSHLSESRYIAVHVRGEKVVIQHDLKRLKKCLRLLVNLVENTKKSFGIANVFVATDMSSFGSGSWAGSLKTEGLDAHALKIIQSTLTERMGAVVYKPSADWQTPDRGAVSLVELSIMAHAQHLLTIGTGAFQEWVVAKFLEFHKNDDPELWSLARLCSLP